MQAVTVQPGDLLFCRSKSVVGELIRFGQATRYHGWWRAIINAVTRRPAAEDDVCWGNHIAVCVGDSIIEAQASGLTRSSLTRYGVTNSMILPLDKVLPGVTDAERARLVAFAEAQLERHDRYGWLSIASIIFELLTPARLDVSWDGALICSAFGAQAWEHAGVTLTTRSSLTTMPADLRAMVA